MTIFNMLFCGVSVYRLLFFLLKMEIEKDFLKFTEAFLGYVVMVFLYQFYSLYLGSGNWVFKLATVVSNMMVIYYICAMKRTGLAKKRVI